MKQKELLALLKKEKKSEEKKKEEILAKGMNEFRDLKTLEKYVSRCLDIILEDNPDVKDVEVIAGLSESHLASISYNSKMPSQVAEPLAIESAGLGIRFLFTDGQTAEVGTGLVFKRGALNSLVEQAREDKMLDPDFVSLPVPVEGEGKPQSNKYCDEKVKQLGGKELCELANEVVRGALDVYAKANVEDSSTNISLDGHLCIAKEWRAVTSKVKGKRGIDAAEEATKLYASVTSGWEKVSPERKIGFADESKGRSEGAATHLDCFNPKEIGALAARKALELSGGKRIRDGKYKVIFSPQAVAEIMTYVGGPSLNIVTDQEFLDSIFPITDIGRQVISEKLSIYDDPDIEGSISSRRVTTEGIPTKKTVLIEKGILKDFIKDTYYSNKYRELLRSYGLDTTPRNGFSLEGGIISPDLPPYPTNTNLVVEGHDDAIPLERMLSDLEEGEEVLYIDRLWYSYPMHKGKKGVEHQWGNMTSSSPAGAYLIKKKDGRIVKTLIRPNTFRIFMDARDVLLNVEQVSLEREAINGWASDYTIVAPYLKVKGIEVVEVGRYLDAGTPAASDYAA